MVLFEPGHVLKMFLAFRPFEPWRSYKRVLIKKIECINVVVIFASDEHTAGTTAILAVVPIIDQITAQKEKCKNDLKCIQITLILFHISIYTIYKSY